VGITVEANLDFAANDWCNFNLHTAK
jgi:hypothetical protein